MLRERLKNLFGYKHDETMKNYTIPKADLEHIVTTAQHIWPALQNARIFITGGTGFVGKWIIEGLLHASEHLGLNIEIVVLSRNPDVFHKQTPHLASKKALTFVTGDITDHPFPDGAFTHIIHAATDVTLLHTSEGYDAIVNGAKRVLDFAKQREVRDVLLVSSGAVYGTQPADLKLMGESYESTPHTDYGRGKLSAEELSVTYNKEYGMRCTIARCFSLIGPYMPLAASFAAGNFIADLAHNRTIVMKSDGTSQRSYLYAADAAVWLLTILAKGKAGVPYNVGSQEEVTILELAQKIAAMASPPLTITMQGTASGGISDRYVPDTTLARDTLGLKAHIPLDEALKRTSEWAKIATVE